MDSDDADGEVSEMSVVGVSTVVSSVSDDAEGGETEDTSEEEDDESAEDASPSAVVDSTVEVSSSVLRVDPWVELSAEDTVVAESEVPSDEAEEAA